MRKGEQVATKLLHAREISVASQLGFGPLATDLFYRLSKRLLDVVLASILLVLLAPLLVIIALAVALDSPGPVIFRQKRVLGEQSLSDPHPEQRVFEFYKFRTMYHGADQRLHRQYMSKLINGEIKATEGRKGLYKLERDPRVTKVGRFLRKTSLDELPQLVNILRGEMSFVGPRPAIPYEVQQYKPWHRRRLAVKQGLTGLWQVQGRNELSFDEMVRLDLEYVQKRSLWLDLKIILKTIPVVLGARGAC